MFNTNFAFEPGKITAIMDGGAGSSGKGKIASFVGTFADNWQFCCNAFMSNAAHWVIDDAGKKYLYQSLNSVAHLKDKFEKMYICGGAVTELEPLLREIEEHNLTPDQLGIHPCVAIVQDKDVGYERGTNNFEGDSITAEYSDCMKLGSTLHGVGAARARRILRRSDVKIAKDVPELKDFICWTDREIVDRLKQGQSGLLEIAQGYQLSYLSQFYPKTTSRNCTVMAGLDDCGIPPFYLGNVIINFRTYPIRVNSNKYRHAETDEILTGEMLDELRSTGQNDKIVELKGDSGACYEDQEEITWEEVTANSGMRKYEKDAYITERTSLTRLERRVYTFSKQNLIDAINFNRTSGKTFISLNFINYVDYEMTEASGGMSELTDKAVDWLVENILTAMKTDPVANEAHLGFIGTGAADSDMILLPVDKYGYIHKITTIENTKIKIEEKNDSSD